MAPLPPFVYFAISVMSPVVQTSRNVAVGDTVAVVAEQQKQPCHCRTLSGIGRFDGIAPILPAYLHKPPIFGIGRFTPRADFIFAVQLDCPLAALLLQNEHFCQAGRGMRIIYPFFFKVVGKTRIEFVARGFAVASNGMSGRAFHTVGRISKILTALGRVGQLAFFSCQRAVVMLFDYMTDGGIIGRCRQSRHGQYGRDKGRNDAFHSKLLILCLMRRTDGQTVAPPQRAKKRLTQSLPLRSYAKNCGVFQTKAV